GTRALAARRLCRALKRARLRCALVGRAKQFGSALLLYKLQYLLEELKAIFLEKNEMSRVRDQGAAFDRRMHEIAHQSITILRKGPCIKGAGDEQGRNVNTRCVP